jgi:homoserine O-succinyltransferase
MKLKIAVLNLMPDKKATQEQYESLLKEAGAYFNLTLVRTASYESKNTDGAYLAQNYVTTEDIQNENFDIFIVTGAPVEHLAFEEVAYWEELKKTLTFTRRCSLFNIFVCWGAQAALYHFYGIGKRDLPQKYFGIFEAEAENKKSTFFAGFEGKFLIPHSRHTTIDRKELEKNKDLIIEAARGPEISVVSSVDRRNLFITGHPEYGAQTLHLEYKRDIEKGFKIDKPFNYYPGDDAGLSPVNTWRGAAVSFYGNIIKHVNNLKGETV